MTTYNPHAALKAHLAKHRYTKGRNTGTAPADHYRRGKSHFRVEDCGQDMCVTFYNTVIIRVTPDNTLTLNASGYDDAPTTRAAMEQGLARAGIPSCMYSHRPHGVSETYIRVGPAMCSQSYKFYNGMQFNADLQLTTPPQPPAMKRINREESKEFMQGLKTSGFKDMFPILFATCEPTDQRILLEAYMLTDADYADRWPAFVATFKYERTYVNRSFGWGLRQVGRNYRDRRDITAKECWAKIIAECKRSMYEVTYDTK